MALVIHLPETRVEPAGVRAETPPNTASGPDQSVRTDAVYVVYTTIDETRAAVRVAAGFANALAVPLTVVHLRTVPYRLPVDARNGISPIETAGFVASLRADGLDARLRVYLCRDERRALPFVFKPHSLVLIGGCRCWWPTRSQRLRRLLETAGQFVLFVDATKHREPLRAIANGGRTAATSEEVVHG
jgi:hypothetical protein